MYNVLTYLEEAATRFPDKKAIALEDHAYTFSEIRELAGRLAGAILPLEEGNEPVGVFAERDADTILYFMAVLYSGNFYVPIDPDLPREKMQAVLEDSGMRTILGKTVYQTRAEGCGFTGRYLTLEDAEDLPAPFPEKGGDDPVYMVYTSGSTGKPKGVLKSHGAMISFLETYCSRFDFSEEDVIGSQTPFYFDASAKDIYLMLKTGAGIEIIPTQRFALPTELMLFMNEKKISFASWVPSAISLVAQLNPFSLILPKDLRRLFFVGEVMPMKHLNTWRSALPGIQYVNLYGSSETAGVVCCCEVSGSYADSDVLPIGKPLDNTRIYLLDGDRIITQAGQIGEIYIVSDALALEYWRDPVKTAASFQIRDFGEGPVKCFRSGDLASYDEAGNLTFAARNDDQIKHMGHRIELGEIEAVAGSLPEVDRCCCLYQASRKKIVLFCQLQEGCSLSGQEIKSRLRGMLTVYMLPGKVVVGDLPLSQNGKIDRQALKKKL